SSYISSFSLLLPPPTAIYPLSLHDALPICCGPSVRRILPSAEISLRMRPPGISAIVRVCPFKSTDRSARSMPARAAVNQISRPEIGRAHSELQSPCNLVCRLLLEKKKKKNN